MSTTRLSHNAARNQNHDGRRGTGAGLRRALVLTLAVLLITAGLSVPQWISQVAGAVAEAAGTGTGGQFVPLAARLVDTRDGTGGFTGPLSPNVYQSFQAAGVAGLPASGVTALAVTLTAINGTGSAGWLNVEPYSSTPIGATTMLLYSDNETVSNTGIVELSSGGKFMLAAPSAVDVIVDVQGYFAAGNGTPAPGGFVPVTASTLTTLTGLAPNSTTDSIQLTGLAGVPSTATAAFINISVDNSAAGSVDSWLNVYPTGVTRPATSLNYTAGTQNSIGTTVDLNAMGAFSLYVSTLGASITVKIDVYGYFDGEPSNAAYNTNQARLYDSRLVTPTPVKIAPDTSLAVTVGGVGGMPTHSPSITAFALNITAIDETAPGYLSVNSSDDTLSGLTGVTYQDLYDSNLVLVRPGADEKIIIHNYGTSPVSVAVDAEGWFTNNQALPPAVGSAATTSGNRSSNALLMRNMTDRVQTGVNPTNGNLLITQQLLHLAGVGPEVGIGVRYNSLNDNRPTLNMGLFEAQLFRNPDLSITYTDATGAGFNFTPKTGAPGQYNIPIDINAHLTRTINGSPNAAISAGATYELVFHPSQTKNVYVSDGANLKLVRTVDSTGASTNDIEYTYGTGSNGGKLTTLTDSQGRVVNFGYSSSPNPTQPTSIVDTSLSRTISLEYAGPSGALSKVTDATGAVTTWAYGANGKVASITDAGTGSRTEFTYDATTKKVLSEKFGANSATSYGTWGFAYASTTTPTVTQSATVTDANGNTNVYTIDPATQRVTGTTDGRGLAGTAAFSVHGEVQNRAAPGMSSVSFEYAPDADKTYNLTKMTMPGATSGATGTTTSFTYPAPGGAGATVDYRPSYLTDAENNFTTMTYNDWGQTLTQNVGKADAGSSTPLGGTITYTYQGWPLGAGAAACGGRAGQVCSKVDGKGNTTSYVYNGSGNLVTVTPPTPLGAHTFTYDAAGRRISETDGRANTSYTCYDKNDRVTQTSYTSSNCAVASGVTYTYDTAGNMLTRTDSSGTTTYTWDAQMRVINKDAPGGATNDSAATYDRVGNVLTMIDGGTGAANTTTYRYDAANNLIALAEPGGSCPTTPTYPNATKCTGFGMATSRDLRMKVYFANGVVNTLGYDMADRPTLLTTKNNAGTTTLINQTYKWADSASTDTALMQKVSDFTSTYTPSSTSITYGYDALNRLTTATKTGSNWSWAFDQNGNRTQQTLNGASTYYGYNAADELCWTASTTGTGCTTPTGGTSYAYDGNGNQTTGGSAYSTFNQQTATTTGGSQAYTYTGTSNTTRLTLGTTTFTNSIMNQVVAQTVSGTVTKYVREPDGTPVAMQTGGNSYYYTVDYNKSVLMLTDSTQAAVAAYKYDPYGTATISITGTIATANPWRYATGYQDPNTSNLKLGARYYNPALGRFTQPDPSGQEQNNYVYAGNNPTTYNDPTGFFWSELAGAAAGAFLGAAGGFVEGGPLGALAGGVAGATLGAAAGVAFSEGNDLTWGELGTTVRDYGLGGGIISGVAFAGQALAGG